MNEDQKNEQMYRDVQALFEMPGWTHLRRSWEAEAEQLKEAVFYNAKDEKDLLVARTRWELLTQLVSLPETITEARNAPKEDG